MKPKLEVVVRKSYFGGVGCARKSYLQSHWNRRLHYLVAPAAATAFTCAALIFQLFRRHTVYTCYSEGIALTGFAINQSREIGNFWTNRPLNSDSLKAIQSSLIKEIGGRNIQLVARTLQGNSIQKSLERRFHVVSRKSLIVFGEEIIELCIELRGQPLTSDLKIQNTAELRKPD